MSNNTMNSQPKYFVNLSRNGQMILNTEEIDFGGDTISSVFSRVVDPDRALFLFGGVDYEHIVNENTETDIWVFDKSTCGKRSSSNKISVGRICLNPEWTP
jgi:hypothetical protein